MGYWYAMRKHDCDRQPFIVVMWMPAQNCAGLGPRFLSSRNVHLQATNAMQFVRMCVCAPVWEEVLFRGFLLPSLGRWMPVPGAIAASTLVFAIAHRQGAVPRDRAMCGVACSPMLMLSS